MLIVFVCLILAAIVVGESYLDGFAAINARSEANMEVFNRLDDWLKADLLLLEEEYERLERIEAATFNLFKRREILIQRERLVATCKARQEELSLKKRSIIFLVYEGFWV